MIQSSDAVIVGQLPLPVHLQAGRLTDLIGSCAVPSSSGTRLFIYKDGSAAAVTDASLLVETASSNNSWARQQASVVWGLSFVGDTEHGSLPATSGISSSRGLFHCRTRMKALHTLLQLGRIQLKVTGLISSTDSNQQLQQEASEGDHGDQATSAGPAATIPPAAAPSSSKKPKSKRGSSAATAQQQQLPAVTTAGWIWIAIELLPDYFYTPTTAVEAGGSLSSSARAASCDPIVWTMMTGDEVPNSFNINGDQLIKAVNIVMTMLHDLTMLHQLRRQHHRQHQQQLDLQVESDDELQHIIDQQQHYLQQQQQHSTDAPSNAPEALLASDQYDAQFDLYSFPEAAAAAGSDIRQSLFDWVDSSPWKCEKEDPPGLANTLYRYQRRALAWMVWREQHGAQPQGFNSNIISSQEGLCDGGLPAQLDPAIVAAQGLLGAQLLNPLWSEVKIATLQPPTPPPAAAAAAAAGSCRCCCSPQLKESCCSIPAADCSDCLQHNHQPACVVLWQCVSHGLVSRVRPGGYCGPAGGVLADEMGLGKTVEVLALLLARPPPAHTIGTQGKMPAQKDDLSLSHSDGDNGCSDDGDDDYVWTSGVCPSHKRRHQRQQCQQQQHDSVQDINSCDSETHLSSKRRKVDPADEGVTTDPGSGVTAGPAWPAPGKWAGPTLVVTPPAILQQWVSEAKRHAPGLSVHIYDGLKWQRAQAETEQRKQQGRLSKGARQQQALLEQYNYIINGPPDQPAFDAAADAASAVQQLLTADVILTTFDVLQQEVHFSGGNSDRLSSLRHKKRYVVPESPLLQVSWWRVVLDEAQLVGGGFSSTAVMAARLTAQHRWAVTGTPIGTGGLEDVANLLRLIGAAPFDSTYTFKKAIQEPFEASVAAAAALERQQHQQQLDAEIPVCADLTSPDSSDQQQQSCGAVGPVYGRVERDGVRRLLALLQPLMWRSNKEAAAADHPLPPRHVQCALLRFSPAEQSFYNHIVEKTAEANKNLQQQQEQQQQQQEQQEAYITDGPTQQQPGTRGGGRRGRAATAAGAREKQIQQVAAGGILQLRLACIHPQLTSYWRELSRELQLRQGGALSIAEILGRMRDGAQLKLQAAERELCLTLNVLADKVAAQADEAAAAVAGSSPKQQQQQQQLPSARRKRGNSKKGRRARAADATAAAASDSDGCDSHDDSYESAAAAAGSSQQAISTKKPKKRVRFDADAAAGADSNGDLPGASGAGSSRRRSSSDASLDDGQSVDEMRQTALKLLEDSYKVGEYGIAALTSGSAAPEPLVDIAGGDATWRAWKHVGLHTAQSLSTICEQLHMSIKSELYAADVARKRSELLETVDADVARAADKYDKQRGRLQELVVELTGHWDQAAAAGVPLTHMTGCATSAAWIDDLADRITAAKAAEQQSRQQVVDGQGVTLTTVLLGQHVPKLLESVEAAAAADKTLLEGIVGQVHTRKISSLLRTLLAQLSSRTTVDTNRNLRFASETVGDAAAAAAAAAKRGSGRSAAGLGTRIGREGDEYHPESDQELLSEDDDLDRELPRHVRTTAAAAATGSSSSRVATAAVGGTVAAGAAAWSHGLDPHFTLDPQLQRQQQQVDRSCAQASTAATAAGSDAESTALTAAHAATYQFLDCLPERRVLWRLLFRGTMAPYYSGAAAAAAAGDRRIAAAAPDSSSSISGVIVATPDSFAAALGGLLQVYAGTAYGRNPTITTGSSSRRSLQHNARDAVMHDTLSGQHLVVDEYSSRVCITQAGSLMRQMIRRLEKRETGFIRAVNSAATAAPGGDNLAAAAKLTDVYLQQQRQAADLDSTAAALDPDHPIQISEVNIPLLLQQLPVSAVAAAGEAARVRVELCRQHRDVYVAELGLELAQHNRQLMMEEADAAASGQMSQVLSLSEKDVTDLRKSVSELTKKCDELLRHKRFLANQAADSTHFGKASKHKQEKSTAVTVEGLSPAAGAAGAGADGDDDNADDLECAVCRSTMSDELQVFPCGHYFCDGCAAVQLSQPSPSCPYCRARLTKSGVFRVSLAGSGAHEAEVDPPEGREVADYKVTGSWMTKLEAVLRRVLHMRSVDPSAKALLFSQFPDALVLASKALDVLKIKHVSLGLGGGKDRRMATRTAVKQFNEDSEVCIFLLSLRAGSAGLTLTVANRVFLLEPALDPAIEQQAVARVHRIGQEREVIITRLLVQGTIEEQVLRISEAKQALLTEASQHHQHPHRSKNQQQQSHDQAATAPQLSDQDDLQQLAAGAGADAGAGAGAGGVGLFSSPRKRRHSKSLSLGVADLGGDMDGTAADHISSSAPTTLQSLAPKKEQLGREDVAGLLAAVMKQAIRQ